MNTGVSKQIAVIAGPTGSGESTITNEIVKRFPHKIVRLVTATTREPRPGEQNGVDYFFFTKDEFAAARNAGEIVEETYVPNRDIYYGTYKPDLEAKLKRGLMIVINPDIVGARYYKEHYNASTVFIEPGNIEEIPTRLKKRNPEMSEEDINKRFENAKAEIKNDRPFYDYVIVNGNGKLQEAVEGVISILRKEGYNI